MAIPNPYQQYQKNAVNSASPGELTLMLFNGAVKFINLAISGLDEKNYDKVNENIIKAQDIVNYLASTLDMNIDISKNLSSLYRFMYRRLVHANIKKEKDVLLEVLGLVEDLRDTWKDVVKQVNG